MKLSEIKEAGASLPGDCGSCPETPPSWFDESRFKRGREFFRKHIWAIGYSWHVSLATGFVLQNLLDALVFTNMSDTPEKAKTRYTHTFAYLALWHTEDVWASGSRAARSVQAVRRMHVGVANKIGAKQGKVAISQYDMALVQSGFMGAIVMYPEKTGVKCSRQELSDYVFFWRSIGYLLGIDDRFNMCSGNLAETRALVKEIEQAYVLPGLQRPPAQFHNMSRVYVEGTQLVAYMPGHTYRAVIHVAQTTMQGGAKPLMFPSLTLTEWFCVYLLRFLVFAARWIPGFEKLMNFNMFNLYKQMQNDSGFKSIFLEKI